MKKKYIINIAICIVAFIIAKYLPEEFFVGQKIEEATYSFSKEELLAFDLIRLSFLIYSLHQMYLALINYFENKGNINNNLKEL